MMCVKTKTGPSQVSGIGLFAAEQIPQGTVVWKFNPTIDLLLSKQEIEKLAEPSKEQLHNYAFIDTKYNKYMLCGDDGRFFNHSQDPNCDDGQPDVTTAIRDIEPGEELTVNYRDFYGDINDHPEIKA